MYSEKELSDSGCLECNFSNNLADTTVWVVDVLDRLSLRCNLIVRAWRAYGRLTRTLVEVFFFLLEVVIGLRSVCVDSAHAESTFPLQ